MKYLIRIVKYFLYISIIMMLALTVLALTGMISTDINVIFKDGVKSLIQIEAMFLAVACIYPKFGFTKRAALTYGELKDIRNGVLEVMEERGYVLESEEGENFTFRRKTFITRLSRMMEDRISLERSASGFYVEGLTKDVTRIVYAIEYKFRNTDEDNQ